MSKGQALAVLKSRTSIYSLPDDKPGLEDVIREFTNRKRKNLNIYYKEETMKKKKLSLLLLAVIIVCLMGCGKEVKAEKIQKLSKIQQQRADKIAEIIIKNYDKYGCLPSVCLGQAMQESTMGEHCYRNNLWGLHGGRRSYETLESGTFAYMKCINNGYYKNAPFERNYEKQIRYIKQGGYCSDSLYVSRVTSIIKRYNFTRYDNKLFEQQAKKKLERKKKQQAQKKKLAKKEAEKELKQGKRLTLGQKIAVRNYGLNEKDWMFVSETDFYMRIQHKRTGQLKTIDKHVLRRS